MLICTFVSFRQVKFHNNRPTGNKRVASEEIIEIEDLAKRKHGDTELAEEKASSSDTIMFKEPAKRDIPKFTKINSTSISVGGLSSKKSILKNLVKKKPVQTTTDPPMSSTAPVITSTVTSTTSTSSISASSKVSEPKPGSAPNALSLLAGYDNNNSDSDCSD